MPNSELFDNLVLDLNLQERQNLLEKLKALSLMSPDPLYVEDSGYDVYLSIEEQYFNLPWFLRFWYFMVSLFRGKTPVKLYEQRQAELLGQSINEQTAGLYNCKTGRLLPVFYTLLENLKAASRFFYSALDAGFNRDKRAFYAFLGSLEMPAVHSQLLDAVDPGMLAGKNPDAGDSELRQISLKLVDDALKGITEDSRTAMYLNARSLFCLKEISFFTFDKLIMAFTFDTALNGYSCSVKNIKDLLVVLNNILFSIRDNPNMTLLESLFVFLLQDRSREPGFDITREMRFLLSKAAESLAVIREFNKRTPLTKIIRCASMNAPVPPKEISGGEDWYFLYRDYWRRLADVNVSGYVREKRRRNLVNSLRVFLNGKNLKTLGNIASEANPDGFPVSKSFSLSFLFTFYAVVFLPELNRILKAIFINGEFVKNENRLEFDESYSGIIRLDETILKFENKIAPYGEYGKQYSLAKQEMTSLQVRRHKIQIIVDEAEEEALEIINTVRKSCKNMISSLNGILGKDPKGIYLGLLNLSRLSEKTVDLINGIYKIIQKLQKTSEILDEIDSLDITQQ